MVAHLDGMFAFVIQEGPHVFAARDPIGIKPLYYGPQGGAPMRAYVFVNVAPEKSVDVVRRLREIAGVDSAEACWGLPDIIALVEVGNLQTLQEFILKEVQKIPGVTQTDTRIIWEV